jgi:hypothetical protein
MMEAVVSTFGLLQTAGQMAKSLVDMRDTALVQKTVIELNCVIISAQQSAVTAQSDQTTLTKQIGQLEAEIVRFKTWETEKQRYQLTELPPGVFVRSLKPEMTGGEPAHQLCEHCYQDGVKAILHRGETSCGRYHLKCTRCGADHTVGHFIAPQRQDRGGSWMAR